MDKDSTYTQESSQRFISDILPELQLSNSCTKHIQTAIRRFNDYLSQQPYVFRQGSGKEETPEIFQKVLDDYIECMNRRGLKSATIEVRQIFAAQFLNSVYNQGIHSINGIYGSHVGVTVLSTGSVSYTHLRAHETRHDL